MSEGQRIAERKKELLKLYPGQHHHHIFFCGGPKCCQEEQGNPVWEHLKNKLKDPIYQGIMRTRTTCLRICAEGPIALVYPEGKWFTRVDEKALDELLENLRGRKCDMGRSPLAESPLGDQS